MAFRNGVRKMTEIIAWWSGGLTSAVACHLALKQFDRVRIVFIDTKNEDDDTYRFKKDCEQWYGQEIETISNPDYESIEECWRRHKSLNVAHGAICSYKLKRVTREKWEKTVSYDHQVFGFEFDKKEFNRARSLKLNHSHTKPIFPLLQAGYDKENCLEIVKNAGIEIPRAYRLGFQNNNCLKTGCVQGGIGYWQKMKAEYPEKFESMAEMEHELTKAKGKPVTMLKNQSKTAKSKFLFLKKHTDYPEVLTVSDIEGKPVKPLVDCNGFCGTNDLNGPSATEGELSFD